MSTAMRLAGFGALALLGACEAASESKISVAGEAPRVVAASDIEAGRYMVMTGGCNDCHTPGYVQSDGQMPESEWLQGSGMGYKGPWGTTYPHNLRLTVANLSEDAWVEVLQTRKSLPPMPWPSVAAMSEADQRNLYRYIKSLPVAGEPAPAALPPGATPTTAYLDFTPVVPAA